MLLVGAGANGMPILETLVIGPHPIVVVEDDPAVVAAAHPAVYTLRTLLEVEKLLDESGFAAPSTTVVTDRGRQMGWALAGA